MSGFNGMFWLAMIAVPCVVMGGAALAWQHRQRLLAVVLLLLPPLAPVAIGLLFLAIINGHPNWR